MTSINFFGERLKSLRTHKKIMQKHLAKQLNITDPAVSMLESGKRLPSYEVLLSVADYFDVSLDYLVGRSDNPNSHRYGFLMFDKNIFPTRLLSLRKAHNITQSQLSKHFNISHSQISKIETGQRLASIELLYALADYFNVSIDYLVGRSDNPQINK